MDKYEYRVKTEQMLEYMENKAYKKAMDIADTIDWRRVKNSTMLCDVSEIYEYNGEYQKSRDILFLAYDRSPGSRKIVYRLGTLALRVGDANEAMDCYEEFVTLAPKDPNQFILRYKILKAQNAPLEQQIEALSDFKKAEYVEKWAYELAKLYHEAGMTAECLEECDDLILWFSEGKYVYQAMELKMRYKPLTPLQQEKYHHRYDAAPIIPQRKKIKEEAPEVQEKPEVEEVLAQVEEAAGEEPEAVPEKPMFKSSIKQTVSGATLAEALANGVAVASGKEIPKKPEQRKPEVRKPVVRELTDEEVLENRRKAEEAKRTYERPIVNGPVEEAPPIEEMFRKDKPVIEDIPDMPASHRVKSVAEKKAAQAEEAEAAKEETQITGQMRIEEILLAWEEKQKELEKEIEVKKAEAEVQAEEARKEREEAKRKKEEEAALAGETKDIQLALSEDVQKLMEDLENGVDIPDPFEDKEYNEEPEEEQEDEEVENKGSLVEEFSVSLDDDDEEYDDEESEDEEYEDEEYEDEEYEDEEYEDEEYEDEEYEDEEYEDEEYEDEEYEDEEYEDEEYEDEEYEDEEYEDEEYEDEESEDEEYDVESFFDDEEADENDEFYDDDEEEEEEPIVEEPKKPSRKEAKKEPKRSLIEEIEEEEEAARKSPGGVSFDTGFVVQGRYDLSATSEIGLKAGLTEEQKKLFSYFVPVRGMSEQIVEVLDADKKCKGRRGTSRTGNLLVIGRKGSGKTVLAVDIVKAIQKERKMKQGKVAIVTGEALNKKDLGTIVNKLNGGALIVEKAAKMNARTVRELNEVMEGKTGELFFVLEEQRKPLEKMLAAHPDFKKKFTSKLELPIFINDELVTFAQSYAKENGYKIDEMGILALYSRIDMMQREDHIVSVAEVKDIMDQAIEHSHSANVKHLMKKVFGKNRDDSDRVILKEDDFK